MISLELEEPDVGWSGRIAGIDLNPEGLACTIVSSDGNLIATRFFGDRKLITTRGNKRKWVLEHLVNKMLSWAQCTYQCNAVALEDLKFLGAYDSSRRNNFVLSNFMNRKMANRIKLAALKKGMFSTQTPAPYTSAVATMKYGRNFGGFSRHQLAAFVIARRALGFGEIPIPHCIPRTKKEKRMWNYCAEGYGHQSQVQTWSRREPLERKSAGNANGGGLVAKLPTAPSAATPQTGSSHRDSVEQKSGENIGNLIGRAGRVHPNGHTSRGDGARGDRVNLPSFNEMASGPAGERCSGAGTKLSTNQKIPATNG